MVVHSVRPIVRVLRQASLATVLVACSACSGGGLFGGPPTPTPTSTTRHTPTLTPVPPATDTPQPLAPETPTVPSTPNVEATISTGRTLCERYVAAISGTEKDSPLLDTPEVQELAQIPDLAICGAVVHDSDTVCKRLYAASQILTDVCVRMRSIFHELRAYPGHSRSFMFDDVDLAGCRSLASLPPGTCDATREALRSGDAKKCAQTGDGESICRAYLSLDASLCHAQGKLTEAKGLGDEKRSAKSVIEDRCKRQIETRAVFAKGLKELAQSGPALERALARAALGQRDACASFAQAALDRCVQKAKARGPGTAAIVAPVPGSPAPAPTAPLSSWTREWSR